MTSQDDKPTSLMDDAIPGETPVQRALRHKRGLIEAREKPPRGGRFQREQAAKVKSGAARPWTHK